MTESPQDWTTWIITTIMAALTTMIGTVVFLAKLIESKYVSEIRDLKESFINYKTFADNRAQEIITKHSECMEAHHKAEIRIAQLEAIREHDKNI